MAKYFPIFIFPNITARGLAKGVRWTLFHREVGGVEMAHDGTNERCWCSPVAIPTDILEEEGYTYEEYMRITSSSLH